MGKRICIVSSAVHIGANPPLMAIIFRPATVQNTFENIKETEVFTINHVGPFLKRPKPQRGMKNQNQNLRPLV